MIEEEKGSGTDIGNGLNRAPAPGDSEDPGGTGGSSGGGTIAGAGEPSGGTLSGGTESVGGSPVSTPTDTQVGPETGGIASLDPSGVAREAAALGGADGSLADAAQRANGASD